MRYNEYTGVSDEMQKPTKGADGRGIYSPVYFGKDSYFEIPKDQIVYCQFCGSRLSLYNPTDSCYSQPCQAKLREMQRDANNRAALLASDRSRIRREKVIAERQRQRQIEFEGRSKGGNPNLTAMNRGELDD